MLRLDVPKPESRLTATARADALSAFRAEIISRLWQAIAFIEETRADLLKHVPQTGAREVAIDEVRIASTHLTVAAGVLVPRELAHRARAARAMRNHKRDKKPATRVGRAVTQSEG